ncbi:N-acetylgalactosamine-6-sulfatase [Bryobacterales bacterium F-183]|nr:N-acetylgalactosamine-6-sulfatase [Bryobacterales bacterium F-183]
MNRREFLQQAAATMGYAVAGGASVCSSAATPLQQPRRLDNIIVIFCDDLGMGDIGPYGSRIPTPNLNRMAEEGVMLKQFYAAPVCSVSRAALLTGRYGVRGGVPGVQHPNDTYGLSRSETTIAEMLKPRGYKTACIGKWHLGIMPQFLPTARGFDEYFGIPYSNDQNPAVLMRGTEVVETKVDQDSLTSRYTAEAIQFIQRNQDTPFFLYLPFSAPHIPLGASADFRGKSGLGLYGDAVMEIDWSTGQILETLKNLNIDDRTLVIFSSDNGPWFQGSPGSLRGRKGQTFEGGMRVPFLARLPGAFPQGAKVDTFATTMDILPTIARLAGAPLPANPLDGVDIWPILTGEVDRVPRPPYLYIHEYDIQCARLGRWKLHVARENAPAYAPTPSEGRLNLRLVNPELYDIDADPEESYSAAADNPRVVELIQARIAEVLKTMPQQVQDAWKATLARPVSPVNEGDWPQLLKTQ